MSLTLDQNQATYQVRAFKPGQIQVNQQTFTQSIIVGPHTLIESWAPQHISELTHDHLKIILDLRPAILVIGTGEELQFPAVELYGDLINEGIGVEIMDTGAACRTFNVLTAENRNVVAAMIIR